MPGVPVVGEDGASEGFVTDGYLIASALPRYMRLMDNRSYVARSFYRRKYDAVKMLRPSRRNSEMEHERLYPPTQRGVPSSLKLQKRGEPEGSIEARALAPHRCGTPRLPVSRAPPSPQVVQYGEDQAAP